MAEDIAFNLINEIDVPETEARIAAYRAENAALIQLNIQREKLEMQEVAEDEERERLKREERMRLIRQEEEEERLEREKDRKAIIEGLVSVLLGLYSFQYDISGKNSVRNPRRKALPQRSSPKSAQKHTNAVPPKQHLPRPPPMCVAPAHGLPPLASYLTPLMYLSRITGILTTTSLPSEQTTMIFRARLFWLTETELCELVDIGLMRHGEEQLEWRLRD